MSLSKNMKRAAALKYSQNKDGTAPIIVASGLGYVAEKIVDVAQENNIPIYRDDSLSSLLAQLDVGSQIPEELYQAIVDIYVYFLNYAIPNNIAAVDNNDIAVPITNNDENKIESDEFIE